MIDAGQKQEELVQQQHQSTELLIMLSANYTQFTNKRQVLTEDKN